ncbi:MAG: UDP-N-acetylglucosamine--N-acetylmuramyl-(pentapeptide) pyrophosphoryl-undecaprenol N-acetylglucosamine transferase [Rhodothermaceae bacterium]|nr:MAG: UDP-N-acetylglucosamine--N-acetylmuramyl-(pentapeptide) pyrophosphoryl-undecaprenol N-acetylglucosamine transferase [Rhodothermaceae bacterium]
MERAPRILFAGGGTGGHVYPAIAVADAVRRLVPEAAIAFAGTETRMEWDAVPRAGYPIHPITVVGLQRRLTPANLAFPFKLVRGLVQSRRLIEAFDPDVVVGTGGFVAGPVLLAAHLHGRPLVLQEQNAYPGMTNRLLARWAAEVHIAFPEAQQAFPPGKCVLSGNPTRAALRTADPHEARRHFELPEGAGGAGAPVLLVFGGSLGSQALNAAMERHLAALLDAGDVFVIWQTGSRYFERLQARVPAHPRLRLVPYIDRMDLAYAAADVALCRAGAITCSELMVTGTPAVLVPSPNVAEDHQTVNARSMERAGAAVLLPEARLEADLVEAVRGLLQDPERRAAMAAAARAQARPDAAERIAHAVLARAGYRLATTV